MVCFLRRLNSLSFPLSLHRCFLFFFFPIHDTYLFLLPVIYLRDEAYSNFSFAFGRLL